MFLDLFLCIRYRTRLDPQSIVRLRQKVSLIRHRGSINQSGDGIRNKKGQQGEREGRWCLNTLGRGGQWGTGATHSGGAMRIDWVRLERESETRWNIPKLTQNTNMNTPNIFQAPHILKSKSILVPQEVWNTNETMCYFFWGAWIDGPDQKKKTYIDSQWRLLVFHFWHLLEIVSHMDVKHKNPSILYLYLLLFQTQQRQCCKRKTSSNLKTDGAHRGRHLCEAHPRPRKTFYFISMLFSEFALQTNGTAERHYWTSENITMHSLLICLNSTFC